MNNRHGQDDARDLDDRDFGTLQIRVEDLRQSWPHALGQMLELHAQSVEEAKSVVTQLIGLRNQLRSQLTGMYEFSSDMQGGIARLLNGPHGLLSDIRDETAQMMAWQRREQQELFKAFQQDLEGHFQHRHANLLKSMETQTAEFRESVTERISALQEQAQAVTAQVQQLRNERRKNEAVLAEVRRRNGQGWLKRLGRELTARWKARPCN